MSLSETLDGVKAHVKQVAPAEIFEVFEGAVTNQVVKESDFAAVGATVADFKLADATGGQVSLDELVADGPAVLTFYRGGWCPYCNVALRSYQQELLPELKKLGVRLAAISPQLPDGSLSTKEANELDFAVLSDVGNEVARTLGITFQPTPEVQAAGKALGSDLNKVNGSTELELPHPTVLIVGQDKTIRFIDVHPDYTTRTEPAAVLAALG
ncbi:MAG: peroxiredoxin-like protein [Amycolatopsis sp.]|jgi:peroxiredoxin|uniref:peroxiredoxin-like family protein n=1 Tax=Amycolatopsis sp. TaxID=37632 RepID=UPI00261B9D46|nr:peroxiredoxin-like family protein [Amycolatopsis sp.]MCU1683656.1 peroxiredoxin-like protein [Amycolatopsis sp.]